jgi:uncharacterized protein (DUF2249 family)
MEIDIREVPENEHLEKVLAAFPHLERGEVLTLLCADEPAVLEASVRTALGSSADVQKMRWGIKEQPWILHLKQSLKPSAVEPA